MCLNKVISGYQYYHCHCHACHNAEYQIEFAGEEILRFAKLFMFLMASK